MPCRHVSQLIAVVITIIIGIIPVAVWPDEAEAAEMAMMEMADVMHSGNSQSTSGKRAQRHRAGHACGHPPEAAGAETAAMKSTTVEPSATTVTAGQSVGRNTGDADRSHRGEDKRDLPEHWLTPNSSSPARCQHRTSRIISRHHDRSRIFAKELHRSKPNEPALNGTAATIAAATAAEDDDRDWKAGRSGSGAGLSAMPQKMIGEHTGDHCLADRHCANADTGIVTSLGQDLGLGTRAVDRTPRRQDRRRRFDGKARHDGLPGRDAAENAAGMIGHEHRTVVAHADFIGVLLSGQLCGGHARADLDALDGIDAHQRRSQIAVELAVDRRTETRGHAFRHDLDHRTDRRAALANAVEIIGIERGAVLVGAEERILVDLVPVPVVAIDLVRSHLHQRATHRHARQDLAGDRTGRNPARRLAGG